VIVFEAGLLSSYTIVTSQPPDIGKLIDMQISKLTDIWDVITLKTENMTVKTYNVTNPDVVAPVLISKTGLSGINVDTLSAVIINSVGTDTVNITLSATGYKENQTGGVKSNGTSSTGQIVIRQSEIYSITAVAIGKKKSRGIEVDVNTIQITSVKRLYNQ
jgi:hypothetical protein